MGIGGSWGPEPITADQAGRAFAALDAALDAGFRFFDHADIYGRGKSEEIFGRYMTETSLRRDEIFIQSKAAILFPGNPSPDSPGRFDFSADHIISSVEGSLRRLGTDYLDVFLLHRPDPLMEGEEVARAFNSLEHSGKVRHFGVSNHSATRIAWLQSFLDQKIEVNQLEFSLGHRGLVEAEVLVNQFGPGSNGGGAPTFSDPGTLDYCRLNSIGVQAWSPLARGRYSGAPLDGSLDDAGKQAVEATKAYLAELAEELSCSAEAILTSWITRIPGGIRPVIGTTNPGRIASCAESGNISLSREQWYKLLVLARGEALP